MFSEYFTVHKEKTNQTGKNQDLWKETIMNYENRNSQEVVGVQKGKEVHYTDRALLLLSFQHTPTQNLKHVLGALHINTVNQKKKILQEIFRLIREGIVYIPRGLPELIEDGLDSNNLDDIDLCLLRPYDQIIHLITNEISKSNGNDD